MSSLLNRRDRPLILRRFAHKLQYSGPEQNHWLESAPDDIEEARDGRLDCPPPRVSSFLDVMPMTFPDPALLYELLLTLVVEPGFVGGLVSRFSEKPGKCRLVGPWVMS